MVRTSNRSLFLISFDNGESYEDHNRDPLWFVKTEAAAKRVVAKMDKWLEKQRDQLPEKPVVANYATEDEWWAAHEEWEKNVMTLVPPYGLVGFLDNLRWGRDASLMISEIPLMPSKPPFTTA